MPVEQELHAYIGGVCNEMGCSSIIVGGYTDHIHILCLLSSKVALMDLVRNVKAKSSRWMKTKDKSLVNFTWQKGYGGFALRESNTGVVINYIKNQHEHHSKKTFKEEYRQILEEENAEYDERYLWD
jgi:REP element-mobilizing transposase RayT